VIIAYFQCLILLFQSVHHRSESYSVEGSQFCRFWALT
jgi:hypothetical protein